MFFRQSTMVLKLMKIKINQLILFSIVFILWFLASCAPGEIEGTNPLITGSKESISISDSERVTTEQKGTVTFNVVLKVQPSTNVFIRLQTSDSSEGVFLIDNETTTTTLILSFSPTNWSLVQTVTVIGQSDNVKDGDRSYQISFEIISTDPAYTGIKLPPIILTNLDSDVSQLIVTPVRGNTTEFPSSHPLFVSTELKVSLSSRPSAPVNLSVGPAEVLKELQVSKKSLTLTQDNWFMKNRIIVTGINDDIAEGDRTYQLTLTATSDDFNYSYLTEIISIFNMDDDTPGVHISVLSANDSGGNTSEAGGESTFTVHLKNRPADTVTVTVESLDTSEGVVVSGKELLFTPANWSVKQTVRLVGQDDLIQDADPDDIANQTRYEIKLTTSSNDRDYHNLSSTVSAFNTDDDTAGFFVIAPARTTTSEIGGKEKIRIRLTSQPTTRVTVSPSISETLEGKIILPSDDPDCLNNVEFTSLDWNRQKTVCVAGVNDFKIDGPQPFSLSFSNAVSEDTRYNELDPNANIAGGTILFTNLDDDVAGLLIGPQINRAQADQETTIYPVQLRAQPELAVKVNISPTNTTAEKVSALLTQSLTFTQENWNVPQVLALSRKTSNSDLQLLFQFETKDTHYQKANNIIQNFQLTPAPSAITPEILVKRDNQTLWYTSEDLEAVSFSLQLSRQPTHDVVLTMRTDNATEGQIAFGNNRVNSHRITFTPKNWSTFQTAQIVGVDDNIIDGNHPYNIQFDPAQSDDSAFHGKYPSAIALINRDNDHDPPIGRPIDNVTIRANIDIEACRVETGANTQIFEVRLKDGHQTSEDNQTKIATIQVQLKEKPDYPVIIEVSNGDTSEGILLDKTNRITFSTSNWNVAQEIRVRGQDDLFDDGDQPYYIHLNRALSNDANFNGQNPPDVCLVNIDNDAAGVAFTQSQIRVAESGTNREVRLQVRLTSQPLNSVVFKTVVVEHRADDQISAVISTGERLAFNTTDWDKGKTLTITANNTNVVDGNRLFDVRLTIDNMSTQEPQYRRTPTITIPGIRIDDNVNDVLFDYPTTFVTTESGGLTNFSIKLRSQPAQEIALDITSDNTKEGAVSPNQLFFTPTNWDQWQKLTVSGVNDYEVDQDQSFAIIIQDNGTYLNLPRSLTFLNLNEDVAGVTFNQYDTVTDEFGAVARIGVFLNSRPSDNVTITAKSNDTTEGIVNNAGNLQRLTFTRENWFREQIIHVYGLGEFGLPESQKDITNQSYRIILDEIQSNDHNYNGIKSTDIELINIDIDASP